MARHPRRLFTPTRYLGHGLQMCTAYLGQMAPTAYITNCATFGTADLLRRVTVVAYRTRELQLAFPDEGFGTAERRRWETDEAWQATREALELALIAYDWGEAFTAVNLVLRPMLDDLLRPPAGRGRPGERRHLRVAAAVQPPSRCPAQPALEHGGGPFRGRAAA